MYDDEIFTFCQDQARMTRIPLLKSLQEVATACALITLSGCASNSPITDANWPQNKPSIDGYNIEQSKRVLLHGLSEINERALDEPSIEKLVVRGLRGLVEVDPLFSITETNERLRTYIGTELASDLIKPSSNRITEWVDMFHGAVIGSRRKSLLLHSADKEQIYHAFFETSLQGLDPYSRYAGKLQARSNRETRNGFSGIGIRFLIDELGLNITAVQNNAPAAVAGLQVGDIITHVDGISIVSKKRWSVRRLLRGTAGTKTKFIIIREKLGAAFPATLTRGLIVAPTVDTKVVDGIAVIKIHSFNQQTTQSVNAELTRILTAYSSILGIVLDLRGDPGGLLDQAVSVSDLFMETGHIVSTRGRHLESIQLYEAFAGDIAEGRPLIVLTDSRSASAAEIVAAAIQDNGRGFVVGTSTYGKGTVQTVIRLPNNGEITLTWSQFHAPDGYAIENLGILPFVCTSGLSGSAEKVLRSWHTAGSRIANMKAQWRTVAPHDVIARSGLRSLCPAEVRPDTSNDLEIAISLLSDPQLYAQALGYTAITEAQQE